MQLNRRPLHAQTMRCQAYTIIDCRLHVRFKNATASEVACWRPFRAAWILAKHRAHPFELFSREKPLVTCSQRAANGFDIRKLTQRPLANLGVLVIISFASLVRFIYFLLPVIFLLYPWLRLAVRRSETLRSFNNPSEFHYFCELPLLFKTHDDFSLPPGKTLSSKKGE